MISSRHAMELYRQWQVLLVRSTSYPQLRMDADSK